MANPPLAAMLMMDDITEEQRLKEEQEEIERIRKAFGVKPPKEKEQNVKETIDYANMTDEEKYKFEQEKIGDNVGIEIDDKNFRLANKWIMLTYGSTEKPTHLNKRKYIEWMKQKTGNRIEWIRLAHETGHRETPYLHTHVLIEHEKIFDVKNCRYFDYEGHHPNIRKYKKRGIFEERKHYIAKEDPENADLKKKFEPNLVEGILKCETDREALTKFCKTPASASGILAIRGLDTYDFRSNIVIVEPKHKWQTDFIEIVKDKPNRRTVIWIMDTVGNRGKSELTDYLEDTLDRQWCVMGEVPNTKDLAENIITELKRGWKCHGIIFDLTASASEHKGFYDGIECIKNGRITAQKFRGKTVRFDIPHVAVFANFLPDTRRMKLDRWKIFEVKEIEKQLELIAIDTYKLNEQQNADFFETTSTFGRV